MKDIQYKETMMGVFDSPIKVDIGSQSINELFSQKMQDTRRYQDGLAEHTILHYLQLQRFLRFLMRISFMFLN